MNPIQINPIGLIKRNSSDENEKDRSLVSKLIIDKDLNDALDGIDDFSHIYVIFWMDKITKNPHLLHLGNQKNSKRVGILATRAPIHPNPLGLTIVKLLKREENILLVEGIDAFDGTPVLDIKPYPDWEHGTCITVNDFKIPKWLKYEAND